MIGTYITRKTAAALVMALLGLSISAAGGHMLPAKETPAETAAVQETVPASRKAMETRPPETTPAETEPEEQAPAPAPDRFNLTLWYPEGTEDTEDPLASYGGKAFKSFYERDTDWQSNVLAPVDRKPVNVAQSLGRGRESVLGHYNITDSSHEENDSSTWTVSKWKRVTLDFHDGNGTPLSSLSNVREILAMASVYTYYHDPADYELFMSYARSLWNASHSYGASMSSVYYDTDCLTVEQVQKAIEKGSGFHGASQGASGASGTSGARASASDASLSAGAYPATGSDAERILDPSVVQVEDSDWPGTGGDRNGGTAWPQEAGEGAENGAGEGRSVFYGDGRDAAAVPVYGEAGGPGVRNGSEAGPGVILNEGSAEDSYASAGTGNAAMTPDTSSVMLEDTSFDEELYTAQLEAQSAEAMLEEYRQHGTIPEEYLQCPGHLDLTLRASVIKMDGKKNLFTIDKIGSDPASFNDRWQGWTEEAMSYARTLAESDWYQDYGLSASLFSRQAPIEESEIELYMERLPEDVSEARRTLIRAALGSVGRVPYYFGGKAVSADYDANHFYTIVSPDYKGRIFRGLDCSGWLSWIYWNAFGTPLSETSTAGLIHLGRSVKRSDLKPGDIIIRSGTDETLGHVLMFFTWDDSGRALCIHETGGVTNNVTLTLHDANWTLRNLID